MGGKPKTYTNEQLERLTEECMDMRRLINRLKSSPREFCKMFQINYENFLMEMHSNNWIAPEKWRNQIRGILKKTFKEQGYRLERRSNKKV